jgi:hypothetical protein
MIYATDLELLSKTVTLQIDVQINLLQRPLIGKYTLI